MVLVNAGDKVTMTVEGKQFIGEVMEVLKKHTAYPYSTFEKYLTKNLDYWQSRNHYISLMNQLKPKSFERVVLKTENQGILILPCMNGNTVELEDAYGEKHFYTCYHGRITLMV